MTLSAHLEVQRPGWSLELDVEVGRGEVVAMMGPNGAGKSTALGALAGTQRLSAGVVRLGDRVLDGARDGRRDGVAPHERRIGMVFQEPRLFPHLDVLANVAFGLRAQGMSRRDADTRARGWIEQVGLAGREHSAASELSGGEAQRIALARALVTDPEALLLDEPFAAADPSVRTELRALVAGVVERSALPTIVVTQELVDAAVLADRIVILEAGRVTQTGELREISRHPRTAWAAELVGVNLLRGRSDGERVEVDGGARIVAVDPPVGDCFVAIHPTAVALYRQRPEGTPRNVWQLHIGELEQLGSRVRIGLGGALELVAEVTPSAVADLELRTGGEIWAAVKATEVTTYPV